MKKKKVVFFQEWSKDQRHVESYKEWANLKSLNRKPTFLENLTFFFHTKLTICIFDILCGILPDDKMIFKVMVN